MINLGVYGTATPEQLEALKNYPLKNPDVVIMQYFLNDIDYAGLQARLAAEPKPKPAWVEGSYLLDFLYVRLLSKFPRSRIQPGLVGVELRRLRQRRHLETCISRRSKTTSTTWTASARA